MSQRPIDLHEEEDHANYDYDDLESWEEGHDITSVKEPVHNNSDVNLLKGRMLRGEIFYEVDGDYLLYENEESINEESGEDSEENEGYYYDEDNASDFDHEAVNDDEVLSDLSAHIFDEDTHLLVSLDERQVAAQESGLSLDQVPSDRDLRKVNSAAGAVLAWRGLVRRENSKAMFVRPSTAAIAGADKDRDERRAKRREKRKKRPVVPRTEIERDGQ